MNRWLAGVAAVITIGFFTIPAHGQVQVVGFGGAEWDHVDRSIYVLGAGAHTGLGWGPAFTLTGYHISSPVAGETASMVGINPAVGLRHQTERGAVQLNVGYAWLNVTDDEPVPGGATVIGTDDGITLSATGDFWGDGVRQGHGMLFHNLGAGYTYGRLKGTHALFSAGRGQISLGAEVVGQGSGDYSAWQAAPLLQYGTDLFQVAGGAGYKTDSDGSGLYGRLEFAVFP